MRRLLAGATATGLGLVLALAPAGLAQESIPPAYSGSRITTPASVASPAPAITADIVRNYNGNVQGLVVETFLNVPRDLPSGCGSPGEVKLHTTTSRGAQPNTTSSTATASTPCNGTYGIRIVATLKNNLGGSTVDRATLIGSVNVVVPPSAVTGVTSAYDAGSVRITWNAYPSPPKDFKGYVIQVQNGDGWSSIGQVPEGTESFSDGSPPAAGGSVTYRVLARRAGPGDDITCDCGGITTIDIPASTTTTTEPAPGGGGTGGTDGGGGTGGTGGTDGGGGTGGDTTSTTKAPASNGGRTGAGRTFRALPRGQVGVGTKAPRLGTPTGANIPDLLTPDGGFDEELDYGDQELGSGDSEDGLSSFYYEGAGGRGMAVPVATGFVLFAWAVHFRYLARAAKPAPVAASRGVKRGRGARGGARRAGARTKGARSKGARTKGARTEGARAKGARTAGGPARGRRSAPASKRGWA